MFAALSFPVFVLWKPCSSLSMFYSPSVSRCPCWAACFRKRVQRYANFPVRQNAARFFLRFCCIFIAYRGISGRFWGVVCCFLSSDMLYSILQDHWEGWFSGPAFPKKMKMKMQYATLYHEVYKKMGPFMRQAQKTCPQCQSPENDRYLYIMRVWFGFSNKIHYLCIRKAEQEWNGEQVWTRKKSFFKKKCQSISQSSFWA